MGCVWRAAGAALLTRTAADEPALFWYAIVAFMVSHVAFAISNYQPQDADEIGPNAATLGTVGTIALVASDG